MSDRQARAYGLSVVRRWTILVHGPDGVNLLFHAPSAIARPLAMEWEQAGYAVSMRPYSRPESDGISSTFAEAS